MQVLNSDTILVAAENQVSCDVDNEAALLNLTTGVYYGLDTMGAYIWQLVQSPTTIGELRARLLAEYQVDEEVLQRDLFTFVNEMVAAGLLVTSYTTAAG